MDGPHFVDADPNEVAPDDIFDVQQCPDCKAGRMEGRTFLLVIEEGNAGIECPNEGCHGLLMEPEMYVSDKIPVKVHIETTGGTFEYPNDVDVWLAIEPV